MLREQIKEITEKWSNIKKLFKRGLKDRIVALRLSVVKLKPIMVEWSFLREIKQKSKYSYPNTNIWLLKNHQV